jgi:nitroreductase
MKTKLTLFILALLLSANTYSQSQTNTVSDLLQTAFSERNYTSVPVTDQQLDIILKCGIKAPSARNLQPWKFTVIRDEATMKEIIKDIVPGNAIIIVSGQVSQAGTTPDFDCGLAAESMFLAAHGLGLGARIYGSPAGPVNAKKEAYQIPEGYRAVVVLRIGNVEKSPDASSGATTRKSLEEVVNYKK